MVLDQLILYTFYINKYQINLHLDELVLHRMQLDQVGIKYIRWNEN